jgi:hypothetical protein
VIPSASRLVTSLRDLGYDFVQSVADIVDNSIAAEATMVAIDLRFEGPESWFRLADNGSGMQAPEITEAMRYGTQREYSADELGKFGLGLKTASLAQCRRLTVASRTAPERARVEVRCLDLDHVEATDRWEILVLSPSERRPELVDPLQDTQGTVVMWESLDRILGYKVPWGKSAQSALYALAEQLDLHLGMVFHRFLAGEVRGRKKLNITINGTRVDAWDPFARDEKATEVLPGTEIDVQSSEGVGLIRFQPYVLPPRERFSSDAKFHRLAGPSKWNAQQGFYIYRANRMIQSGGWSRMRALDEHVKLARASIDFYPDLDSAFGVNVAKATVTIPPALKERLQTPIENLVRRAQTVYRESPSSSGGGGVARGPIGSSRRGGTAGHGSRVALEAAAKEAGEERALARIVKALKKVAPEVARDLGW